MLLTLWYRAWKRSRFRFRADCEQNFGIMASVAGIGMAIDLNTELKGVLAGDPTVKAQDREELRKKNWLTELIKIQRLDDEGNLKKGCEWLIPRRRLNYDYLNNLSQRCPLPCTIDCFIDNNGECITFEDIQKKANPEPYYYIIIPKIKIKPEDILENSKYSGQSIFMIKDVPLRSLDGQHDVDGTALREWILLAISEIDPVSGLIYDEMREINDRIREVDEKIRMVPQLDLRDKKGKKLPDDKADEERQTLYMAYGEEKLRVTRELQDKEKDLEEHVRWRRTIGDLASHQYHSVDTVIMFPSIKNQTSYVSSVLYFTFVTLTSQGLICTDWTPTRTATPAYGK